MFVLKLREKGIVNSPSDGAFYRRLGVKRIINAASWRTAVGGSLMPGPVVEAMQDASRWFVDLHDLNEKAGNIIATLTGAEAGLVTAGSSAGMLLQAAACMTGADLAKAYQLPDTRAMKNEIVIHRAHRVGYDHSYRATGAVLVEIGDTGPTAEWQLESAINDKTAAVAYIFGPRQGGALPLATVVEIAHAREVPVIVDAAAMLPPPENLTRYVDMGADMVSFSGGKGVLGPQSTGILCGRKDLVDAAYMNSAPNTEGIGRCAKVCKEEIAGLITALELFVETDHQALAASWQAQCEHVVSALQGIPGLRVELVEATPELDEFESATPRVFLFREKSSPGPSEDEIVRQLKDGDPSIRVVEAGFTGGIPISPVTLQKGEEEIVARRLKDILTASG